jgi:hypothetical protein
LVIIALYRKEIDENCENDFDGFLGFFTLVKRINAIFLIF